MITASAHTVHTECTHNNYSQHLYLVHLIVHLSLATSGPDSSTGLTPSPTSFSTPTRPQSTPTPASPPSQLMVIVIAVVATTVLLLLVVGLVVVMVAVVCRRRSKRHVYENTDTDRGVSVQMTDNSTTYYETRVVDVDPPTLTISPTPLSHPTSTHQLLVITSQCRNAPPTNPLWTHPPQITLTSDCYYNTILYKCN